MTGIYFGSAEPFAVEGVRFGWGDTADPELAGLDWAMPTDWSATITAPLDHAAAIRLMDVTGGRTNLRGAAVCACHQLPFPAARDYRRRTRHRNRRGR